MRSLLNFLLRYKNLIIFFILEAVALVMISSSHDYHQSVAFGAARSITGFVAKRIENGHSYFNLRQVNEELVTENLMLRRRIENLEAVPQTGFISINDTLSGIRYTLPECKGNK